MKDISTKTPIEQLNNLGEFDYTLQCGACDFRPHCQCPLAPKKGKGPIELMVISEKPSFEEETCSFSYGDRHNRYLIKALEYFFPSDTLYFTYVVKCFTGSTTKLGKRNTQTCRNIWLDKEIQLFKPKYMLCLGLLPMKIFGGTKFGEIKGNIGFWKSSIHLFNAGKSHIESFEKFITQLKQSK